MSETTEPAEQRARNVEAARRVWSSEAVADLIAAAREQGRREGAEQALLREACDECGDPGAWHGCGRLWSEHPYRADAIARGDQL